MRFAKGTYFQYDGEETTGIFSANGNPFLERLSYVYDFMRTDVRIQACSLCEAGRPIQMQKKQSGKGKQTKEAPDSKERLVTKLLKSDMQKGKGGQLAVKNGDPNSACSYTCGWTWTPWSG